MSNGVCGKCPGKCGWDQHQNGRKKYVYVYTPTTTEETISELLEKYNIATNEKNAKKLLLLKIIKSNCSRILNLQLKKQSALRNLQLSNKC